MSRYGRWCRVAGGALRQHGPTRALPGLHGGVDHLPTRPFVALLSWRPLQRSPARAAAPPAAVRRLRWHIRIVLYAHAVAGIRLAERFTVDCQQFERAPGARGRAWCAAWGAAGRPFISALWVVVPCHCVRSQCEPSVTGWCGVPGRGPGARWHGLFLDGPCM